jgi:hypothetical protein
MTFIALMLVVHFTYRIKTNRFTKNWLDFIVIVDGEQKKKRIGKYYYPAIVVNLIVSFIVSLVLA